MALWKCPRCGTKLVQRNLSHACGDHSVDKFLARTGPRGRALFDRFARLVAACGSCETAPAKTRVAFMVHVRFASVNRVTEEAIHVHFVLPRMLKSGRIHRVDRIGNVFVHHMRLSDFAEFDGQLQDWLRQSRAEYGERKTPAGTVKKAFEPRRPQRRQK